jgi:hypothetical protein
MKPSVGRIVHYVSYGTPNGEYKPECRAAIIAAVKEGQEGLAESCDLVIFNPGGLFFHECPHDEEDKKGGTWHWPERVE